MSDQYFGGKIFMAISDSNKILQAWSDIYEILPSCIH